MSTLVTIATWILILSLITWFVCFVFATGKIAKTLHDIYRMRKKHKEFLEEANRQRGIKKLKKVN